MDEQHQQDPVPVDPALPEQPAEEQANEDQEKYDGGEIPPASPERVEQVEREQGREAEEQSEEQREAGQVVDPTAAPSPPPQAAN